VLRVTSEGHWEPNDTVASEETGPATQYITPQEACTKYNKKPSDQTIMAGFPPSHIITPLLQGKVCQEDLRQSILKALHYPKLQAKLMKDNQWEYTTFHMIDRDALLTKKPQN